MIKSMDFKQAELDERNEDFMCDMVERLLDDDFPCHPGVDRTEVRVSSSGDEGVRKALPWLQRKRFLKLIISARDNVWHLGVVDPGHCCADWHSDGLGRKADVIDNNLSL